MFIKPDRKTIDRRTVILDAALRTFVRRGYPETKVAEIASEAGVAEGTLYNYFASKEDLLLALFDEKWGWIINEIRRKISRLNDPNRKLKAIFSLVVRMFKKNRQLAELFMVDIKQSSVFLNNYTINRIVEFLDLIEEVLEEGKKKGTYRRDLDTRVGTDGYFWCSSGYPSKLGVERINRCQESDLQILSLPGGQDLERYIQIGTGRGKIMIWDDLREFIRFLEEKKDLVRIKAEVDPVLEVTEITDRISKKGGPALLFEKVKGSQMPVAINLFGSYQRMSWALGVDDFNSINQRFTELLRGDFDLNLRQKVEALYNLYKLSASKPKEVRKAPCQEIVMERDFSLFDYPVLKCWPGTEADLSRFLS